MSVSLRSMLVPGATLATVGAVALGPALGAPPAVTLAQPPAAVPAVYIADIQLAGIGRDFYNSASAVVQSAVSWVSWGVGIIPFIGRLISDQIDLIYSGLIQPLIADTVYALSDIVVRPLGILTTATTYVSNLFYTGYTWVTDEIAAFGLPPLLPARRAPMPLASVGGSSTRALAARSAGPRVAAVPARASRIALRGAVRVATVGARQTARAVGEDSTEVRSTARATRGATSRAAKAARTSVESVANTAS